MALEWWTNNMAYVLWSPDFVYFYKYIDRCLIPIWIFWIHNNVGNREGHCPGHKILQKYFRYCTWHYNYDSNVKVLMNHFEFYPFFVSDDNEFVSLDRLITLFADRQQQLGQTILRLWKQVKVLWVLITAKLSILMKLARKTNLKCLLEKSRSSAGFVAGFILSCIDWKFMWEYIPANVRMLAPFATQSFLIAAVLTITWELILASDLMRVRSVTWDSLIEIVWRTISERILENVHTHVTTATWNFLIQTVWKFILGLIRERNHILVQIAFGNSLTRIVWRIICGLTLGRNRILVQSAPWNSRIATA